ncbi:MAG TPA: GatB/YqeY domain-containing protein, partial [Chitinophagales bacterium]|nr:GatB/YqeY domain-containing protein [Chitinophagales bacterium]
LQKLFNQRKESFEIFTKENRAELAVREKEEMDVITSYLPAQMSDDDLKNIVKETIAETGATSVKDMGKVIGSVSKKVAGQAEGARISSLVKELLG